MLKNKWIQAGMPSTTEFLVAMQLEDAAWTRARLIHTLRAELGMDITAFRRLQWLKAGQQDTLRGLTELAQMKQAYVEQADPVITHLERAIKTTRPIAILLVGCMQLGGRWTFHDMVREKFELVLETPNTFLGLFGDEIENFVSGSFVGARSVHEQALDPLLQRVLWDAWLDRIQHRALWGVASQHGTIWDEKRAGLIPIKATYLDRDIPFFDGQGYVKLHVGAQAYKLAVAHAFPGTSMYNPNHAQFRAIWQRYPLADVVAMADKHQYSYQERQYGDKEYLAGDRPTPWVHLIQIGTAKGGNDPYSIRGWARGETEWPWIVLWPDQHLVKVTRHFEDVLLWIDQSD